MKPLARIVSYEIAFHPIVFPQYESVKIGKFSEQNLLNRLKMVQFECPRHSNPYLSSISQVGRIPFPQY